MDLITSKELHDRMSRGEQFYIIDVRERDKYEKYHLPDAFNIDELRFTDAFDENDTAFMDEIKAMCQTGKTPVLYCERGNTSMLIAKKLMSYNIDAYSLYGGVNEYKKYLAYYKN